MEGPWGDAVAPEKREKAPRGFRGAFPNCMPLSRIQMLPGTGSSEGAEGYLRAACSAACFSRYAAIRASASLLGTGV